MYSLLLPKVDLIAQVLGQHVREQRLVPQRGLVELVRNARVRAVHGEGYSARTGV